MIPVDQIVLLYETHAKGLDIIAKALEVSEECVHVTLMENSRAYKKEYLKKARQAGAVAEDRPVVDRMLDILVDLAENSKDEHVQVSCAKFVRDDLKGRRDIVPIDAGIVEGMSQLLERRLGTLQANKQRFLQRENPIEIVVEEQQTA